VSVHHMHTCPYRLCGTESIIFIGQRLDAILVRSVV
jgi:hypothetical protein